MNAYSTLKGVIAGKYRVRCTLPLPAPVQYLFSGQANVLMSLSLSQKPLNLQRNIIMYADVAGQRDITCQTD